MRHRKNRVVAWRPCPWQTLPLRSEPMDSRNLMTTNPPISPSIDRRWAPGSCCSRPRTSATPMLRAVQWGLPEDLPVAGDFDGDGKTDLTVFRPTTGRWFVRFSSSNYDDRGVLPVGTTRRYSRRGRLRCRPQDGSDGLQARRGTLVHPVFFDELRHFDLVPMGPARRRQAHLRGHRPRRDERTGDLPSVHGRMVHPMVFDRILRSALDLVQLGDSWRRSRAGGLRSRREDGPGDLQTLERDLVRPVLFAAVRSEHGGVVPVGPADRHSDFYRSGRRPRGGSDGVPTVNRRMDDAALVYGLLVGQGDDASVGTRRRHPDLDVPVTIYPSRRTIERSHAYSRG